MCRKLLVVKVNHMFREKDVMLSQRQVLTLLLPWFRTEGSRGGRHVESKLQVICKLMVIIK